MLAVAFGTHNTHKRQTSIPLVDDLKNRRGYCQLKEEALDRTMWRNRFGRGFGPVVDRLLMMMMNVHYHIHNSY